MSLHESVIESDPLLQWAFLDKRRLVPKHGHEAIVNSILFGLSHVKVSFQKSRGIEAVESYQRDIRRYFFAAVAHCDGFAIDLPAGVDDGCEHVQQFGAWLQRIRRPDFRKRAALWHRYAQRPPPDW